MNDYERNLFHGICPFKGKKCDKDIDCIKCKTEHKERRSMAKKESQTLVKCKKCVDNEVKQWNRTTLSDLEKYALERYIIWGIVQLALYMLSFDEYNAFKEYIWTEYGFNVGGTSGDKLEDS